MEKAIFAILIGTIVMNAHGETETRQLPAFRVIEANGIGTIRIRKGPQSIKLTVDEGLSARYETTVRGDTLTVGFNCSPATWWALRRLKSCEVDISVPELSGITVNGAGKVIVEDFDYGRLKLTANGAAEIELGGTADEVSASCTGNCRIDASRMDARTGNIGITGSGRFAIRVRERLTASITGAGVLSYWGNPTTEQRITGAGSIRRAGD